MTDYKEQFHNIFVKMNLPSYIDEDLTFKVYQEVLFEISNKLEKLNGQQIPNTVMVFSYIIGELDFIFAPLSKETREQYAKNEEFEKNLISRIVDKIFFNEYAPYKSIALIDKYNPFISTLRFYLNFILDRFTVINTTNKAHLIILGMLRKAFLSCRSITTLLIEGFETEAFSTWRTIHETECIAKIIYENQYLDEVYERHLDYNRAFRNEYEDKEEQQKVIDEIKALLKSHNLKSKDLKKYIEYGWLYSIEDVENKYPGLRLNFRNGVEMAARLSEYSKLYEMSSEIAHSSPILIYSNKKYFLKNTLICLYETFLRIEEIFYNILKASSNSDSQGFYTMRERVIHELNIILIKIKNMPLK